MAQEMKMPMTGGSDSHEPETIGKSYTVFPDSFSDVDGVLKALLAGKATTEGTGPVRPRNAQVRQEGDRRVDRPWNEKDVVLDHRFVQNRP